MGGLFSKNDESRPKAVKISTNIVEIPPFINHTTEYPTFNSNNRYFEGEVVLKNSNGRRYTISCGKKYYLPVGARTTDTEFSRLNQKSKSL